MDLKKKIRELEEANSKLKRDFEIRTRELKTSLEILESQMNKRIQSNEMLTTEKEKLAVTLRSIGEGVISTDKSGKIILINKVAEKLTGYNKENAIGKQLEQIFKPIHRRKKTNLENPVEKIITTALMNNYVRISGLMSHNGNEYVIEEIGAPLKDELSEIIGCIIVFRDISSQIKIEQELFKNQKLESIAILAGGIAHDFNNFLTSILSAFSFLKYNTDSDYKNYKVIVEAEQASIKAKRLANQLLTFSKGSTHIKKIFSPKEVIINTAEFIIRGAKTSIEYEIQDGLWFINADESQITQVIQNLIINAKNALNNRGIIKINAKNVNLDSTNVFLLPQDNYIQINVIDNGPGISHDIIQKIFEPYFTTKPHGTGLGLSICKSIIKQHSGSITVKSNPKEGTNFKILLPAIPSLTPEKELDSQIVPVGAGKILILEDDENFSRIIEIMLKTLGYYTVITKKGEDTVTIFKQEEQKGSPFDIVIVDLTIRGGKGGEDIIQDILDVNKNAKVIVSSGFTTSKVMNDFKNYGFVGCLPKPYTIEELANFINEELEEMV